LEGAEALILRETLPRIHDKISSTPIDPHYFYQSIWAFKKIYESNNEDHVDIGSDVDFVGLLTIVKKVTFVDIRPLLLDLENFTSLKGDILSPPFEENSVLSLSCLHVAEHIGLGRYGDTLDPLGTKKSCNQLSKILAPGGNLFFSLPIGKPKVLFNAHRIHSPQQIIDYSS